MAENTVRMHIPGITGVQTVAEENVAMWEARGGSVVPDLTPAEIEAAAQRVEAEEHDLNRAMLAQQHADTLRRETEELDNLLAAEAAENAQNGESA